MIPALTMGTHSQQTSKAVSPLNQQQPGGGFLPVNFSGRQILVSAGFTIAGMLALSEGIHRTIQICDPLPSGSRIRWHALTSCVLVSAAGGYLAANVGAFVVDQAYNLTESLYDRICSALSNNKQQVNISSSFSTEEKHQNGNYDKEVTNASSSIPEVFDEGGEANAPASLLHTGNNTEGVTLSDNEVDAQRVDILEAPNDADKEEYVNKGDKEGVNLGDKEGLNEADKDRFNGGVKENDDDVELSQSADPGSNGFSYSVEDLAESNSPESVELKDNDV